MDPVSGNSGSGSVSSVGSLGTCTSVNFIFAKLQMELAASAKDSALGYIKQIEGAQAEQKEVADMLQRCRELQNQAKDSGGCTEMPADVREFMDKNNLTYDLTTGGVSKPTKETADSLHNKDEWDVAIQSLQAYQETIGTDIQTKMVYVQDFMGQYNSYTQGANSYADAYRRGSRPVKIPFAGAAPSGWFPYMWGMPLHRMAVAWGYPDLRADLSPTPFFPLLRGGSRGAFHDRTETCGGRIYAGRA